MDLGSSKNICSVNIAWYKGNERQNNFVISTPKYKQLLLANHNKLNVLLLGPQTSKGPAVSLDFQLQMYLITILIPDGPIMVKVLGYRWI